jgi:hypothetical protein
MHYTKIASALVLTVVLSSCGTRSSTEVAAPTGASAPPAGKLAKTDPAALTLTDKDITDRKYHSLGDIKVTVSKNTIFDSDPTPAKVDEALREKAADMGADAVVLVRYGTVGVSFTSWGSLDGSGRAVVYDR